MVWFLPALIGGAASVIGGVINKKSAEKQQRVSNSENKQIRAEDRKWYLDDTKNERLYNERWTQNERGYAQAMRDNDRAYARDVLLSDRRYSEAITSQDRAYLDRRRDADIAQYSNDRNYMQGRSNYLAEKTAASRGIDFTKLRDDAVAAGYNPMTALGMAHAYSKQVDYSLQGGVYSPGANYTALSQQVGGGGGGGGGVPSGAVQSAPPAAGSFQTAGSGYSSQFNPALSSGSFIQEAIERGVDAWTNRPVQKDPLADALRNAFQQDQMAEQVRSSQIPQAQGFGYDLTKQQAFQPAATIGVPKLASEKAKLSPSDELVTPSSVALKYRGDDFLPQSGTSDVSGWEERYGDIPGGLVGADALIYDFGKYARKKWDAKVTPSTRDYVKGAATGSPIMRMKGPVGYNRSRWNGY